jgi:hypothetical protein
VRKAARLFKFLSSLKLAVVVMASLGILSAYGTIIEARYNALYAQKTVYHSVAMYIVLALLVVNLLFVMIDRLPWKRHHVGFILAHIGIITMIVGSILTRLFGVDGSMIFDIGQKNRYALIPAETEFAIYSSFGTGEFQLLHRSTADFLTEPPKPGLYRYALGGKSIQITNHHPFTFRKEQFVASTDANDGPVVRVQLQNERVNVSQWILRDRKNPEDRLDLGPASVVLADVGRPYQGKNEVLLVPSPKGPDVLDYFVYTVSKNGLTKKGQIRAGDSVALGWMGLELRVLKYMPQAKADLLFTVVERPTELTAPAIEFEYDGRKHWLGLNSSLRLFENDKMFLVVFGNRRIDVGFDIDLKRFSIGRYQGTNRAASYASDVGLDDGSEHHISMNNPLKHNGFTFYQASFQEDEQGQPTASILSVNKDPGRWVKYLGAILIVLGSILMFYFKRRMFGAKGH